MSAITLEYRGQIAIITLNSPDKLNALSSNDYFLLAQLMRNVARRDEIYITVLTGEGRFFSAGADVKQDQRQQTEQLQQLQAQPNSKAESGTLRQLTAHNLSHIIDVTEAFYSHPKVLVTALNGPAVGLSAALVAFSDFIYAMPHTYLLAPFTTIGIAAEGGASATFIQRLGFAKAAEALLMSKRITCAELQSCGFVNEVFDTDKDVGRFLECVFQELDKRLHKSLDARSVLRIKSLMRQPSIPLVAAQTIAEALQVTEDLARRAGAAMSSGGIRSQKL